MASALPEKKDGTETKHAKENKDQKEIDVKKLKAALIAGVHQYQKECFVSDAKIHPTSETTPTMHSKFFSTSGEEGLKRSQKIEEYAKQIGENALNILILVLAIINNPKGSTLQEYLIKAIIENGVFTQTEIQAQKNYLIGQEFRKMDATMYALARTPIIPREESTENIIKGFINDAIIARKDKYNDIAERVTVIWSVLNNKNKGANDISMEPFQKELASLATQQHKQ